MDEMENAQRSGNLEFFHNNGHYHIQHGRHSIPVYMDHSDHTDDEDDPQRIIHRNHYSCRRYQTPSTSDEDAYMSDTMFLDSSTNWDSSSDSQSESEMDSEIEDHDVVQDHPNISDEIQDQELETLVQSPTSSDSYSNPSTTHTITPEIHRSRHMNPLYPEDRLLCQLEGEQVITPAQNPIMVFMLKVNDKDFTQTKSESRDTINEKLVSEASPVYYIHLKMLVNIRQSIKEAMHHIAIRLMKPDWRAVIDSRPLYDLVRQYFYEECFMFRYLPKKQPHHISISQSCFNSIIKKYNPMESNPLLRAEEIDFLSMAAQVFQSAHESQLSDTIQSVLDMRFRYPHAIKTLLIAGTLDRDCFNNAHYRSHP